MQAPWDIPPTVPPTGPPPVVDSGRRDILGWLLLLVFFLLLISTAVYQSYNPDVEKGAKEEPKVAKSKYDGAEMQLKIGVALRSLAGKDAGDQADEPLETVVNDVVGDHKTDLLAGRIYAAARTELGKQLAPEDLSALWPSKDPSIQAQAELYSKASLTKAQAEEIRAKIKGDSFLDVLARVHAAEKAGNKDARSELPVGRWAMSLFAIMGALLLFPVGLVLWGVYISHVRSGRWKPKGYPIFYPTLLAADKDALRAAIVMLAWMLVAPLVIMSLLKLPSMIEQMVTSVFTMMLIIIILRIPFGGKAAGWVERLGDRKPMGSLILWGIGGWIANVPVFAFTLVITNALSRLVPEPTHPVSEEILANPSGMVIFAILIVAAVGAPLIEETFFRGMLFPAIGRALASPWWGIAISSFLFAAIHPQGIAGWPSLFGIAAVNAGLTYQTRSLIPAMVLHGLHNASVLTVALLMR